MIHETIQCEYCGMECFEDELTDGKCRECIVEDCRHHNTWNEYQGDNPTRARFIEHCIDCKSWREIRFYFTGEQARAIGKWRDDEVF